MLLQEAKNPSCFLEKKMIVFFFQRCGCGTYCWHTLSFGLVEGWDTYSDASTPSSPLELNSFGHEMRWLPIADNAIHDNWYNCTPERNSSRRCHARHETRMNVERSDLITTFFSSSPSEVIASTRAATSHGRWEWVEGHTEVKVAALQLIDYRETSSPTTENFPCVFQIAEIL